MNEKFPNFQRPFYFFIFSCLIPEDNKITRMVRREQEERDFKSKREMEINAMRAEAARMDAVESTSA